MNMDLISNTVSKTSNTLGKGAGVVGKTALNIGRTASNVATNAGSAVGNGGARVGRLGVTAVTTAGGGVVKTASKAGNAVGKTAKAAASTGVNAATTVGGAVGKSAIAAASTGVDAATTVGGAVGKTAKAGAAIGVTVVATAGGAVGKTALAVGLTGVSAATTAGNVLVSRTTSHRTASGGRRRITEAAKSMDIFCSDFYTEQFVLEEIAKARKNSKIVSLNMEDLILRDSPKILTATTELLLDTAVTPKDLEELQEDEIDSSWRSMGNKGRTEKRVWSEVSFVDAISHSKEYEAFVKAKASFQKNLLLETLSTKVPIKFKAKIELHNMMTVQDVLELLQEIEKDPAVTKVDFPGLSRDLKKVPSQFAENFDVKTREWKENASPIEILLRYGEQDMSMNQEDCQSGFMTEEIVPTDIIKQCRRQIEKPSPLVTAPKEADPCGNNESFSWTEDNVILQLEGVVPIPRRPSKVVRKPRALSPKRKSDSPTRRPTKEGKAPIAKNGVSTKRPLKEGKSKRSSPNLQKEEKQAKSPLEEGRGPSPKGSPRSLSKKVNGGAPTKRLPKNLGKPRASTSPKTNKRMGNRRETVRA